MASPLSLVKQLAQQLVHRRRHDRTANIDSQHDTGHAPLIFETLEPRLLLSADPLGIAAGHAFNEISGTTAADTSGHGIVAALTNSPIFTAVKSGNAVTLDGAKDLLHLAIRARCNSPAA